MWREPDQYRGAVREFQIFTEGNYHSLSLGDDRPPFSVSLPPGPGWVGLPEGRGGGRFEFVEEHLSNLF